MLQRLTVPLLGLALLALLHLWGLLPIFANYGTDLMFRLRGPRPPDQRVVIVGIDEASLERHGAWPFPRRLHAELLGRLSLAGAVGFDILLSEPTADDADLSHAMATGPPVILPLAHDFERRLSRPTPTLSGYTDAGHIETILSGDGIVRATALEKDSAIPAFALSLLRAAGLATATVPDGSPVHLNFYGPEATFLFLSYSDVLAGRHPPDFFRDRLVLVGARALGLGDLHVTPYSRIHPTPGVEIQATILNNLIDNSFLRPLPLLPPLLIAALALLAVFVWPATGERTNLLVNIALLTAVPLAALGLFHQALLLDFTPVVLFLLIAYLGHLVGQLLSAARRILAQARSLDQELDLGLRQVYASIPQRFLQAAPDPDPRTTPAIQRTLDRLQATVNALRLQHHFLENLLTRELPPLILWERQTGAVVLANTAFRRFWHLFRPEEPHLPDCARFLDCCGLRPNDGEEAGSDPAARPASYVEVGATGTGGRRFYQTALHALRSEESDFSAILAVLQDVTDLRELERVKDEVVSIVSHQLKLPLTTILGYGEILAATLTDERGRYAGEICTQSRRLSRLIEEFLDIARLESGRQQVRRYPFSLNRMLEDAAASLAAEAERKRISIVLDLPHKTTPLLGDEPLLLQAMINLLDNAVKYSPAGTAVTVRLMEEPDRFLLTVADQGPGIPPEEREQVFAKFHRGRDSGDEEGFGLGLHLVRQIIDRHQGEIRVAEAPPPGAVFHIILAKTGT